MKRKFYPPIKSVTMLNQNNVYEIEVSGINDELLGSIPKGDGITPEKAYQMFLDKFSTKDKCMENSDIKVKGIQYKLTETLKQEIRKMMKPIVWEE